MQAAVQVVQKRMRHFDGCFVQFRCDEKGFLSISAFGLPGNSHEDGPSRAVAAALSVVAAMRNVDQVWPLMIPRLLQAHGAVPQLKACLHETH